MDSQQIFIKVYDPVREIFLTGDEITDYAKYIPVFEGGKLIIGTNDDNKDWHECLVFPWSGQRDRNGKNLYLGDRVKHIHSNLSAEVDIHHGRWVLRYDDKDITPLYERVNYIEFVNDPVIKN